jgi:hypothetical protein
MSSKANQLKAMSELYRIAAEIAVMSDKAGTPVPQAVASLLAFGEPPTKIAAKTPNIQGSQEKISWRHNVPCPFRRPPQVHPASVSVDLKAVGVLTFVRLVLAGQMFPVQSRQVVDAVLGYIPASSSVAVYNAASRLTTLKVLDASDAGWKLRDPKAAPLEFEGRLWGPKEVFQKVEIASCRKEIILEFLKVGPMPRAEILAGLRATPWVTVPFNEGLVKNDLEYLRGQDKVVRDDETWTWMLKQHPKGQLKLAGTA